MKQDTKDISLTIKPLPAHIQIITNNHEQKLPYNDVTNSFIHYININKVPPQVQEFFTDLRVKVIKSENEKYIVDLKSETSHEINLNPTVNVYHEEKIKHYNETKFDNIKFKKKEYKRKIIHVINDVRAKKYENSLLSFEGKNKKCHNFMVLYRNSQTSCGDSYNMVSLNTKSLKELKKTGKYGKSNENETNKIGLTTFGTGSFEGIKFNSKLGIKMHDPDLYGNFNTINNDKQYTIKPSINEILDEHPIYLSVFYVSTDTGYCFIRYGYEFGTHTKGFIIKHAAPKNIDEYFENIKNNYAYLGYKLKREIGIERQPIKKQPVKDISSRIHESASIKKSSSYEKNPYQVVRTNIRPPNPMPPIKSHYTNHPIYNQMDPQIMNRRAKPMNMYNPYLQSGMINPSIGGNEGNLSYIPRQNNDPGGYNHDKNQSYSRNMQRSIEIGNKIYNNPYLSTNQDTTYASPHTYMPKSLDYINEMPAIQMQNNMRIRQPYGVPSVNRMQQYPRHQSPTMPPEINFHSPANLSNQSYNQKLNYAINPNTIFDDTRVKNKHNTNTNAYVKQQNQNTEYMNKKQRKDEAQDMPDFF